MTMSAAQRRFYRRHTGAALHDILVRDVERQMDRFGYGAPVVPNGGDITYRPPGVRIDRDVSPAPRTLSVNQSMQSPVATVEIPHEVLTDLRFGDKLVMEVVLDEGRPAMQLSKM